MGSIKMFLGIFVIVAGVYVSAKVVPAYFENYQFQDAIKDEATRDTYAPAGIAHGPAFRRFHRE